MLCFEGIALMLNIFLGRASVPNYRVVAPPDGEIHQITVAEEVIASVTSGEVAYSKC